jgi:ABC-type amino acid transport substrate-binding protein
MNRILMLLLFILFCLFPDTLSGREVRVGIYQNPPKVFLDESKNPQGIFIDIMNDIARREHWDVKYIFNT